MMDAIYWVIGFLSLGFFKKAATNSMDVVEDAAKRLGIKE